MMFIGMCIYSFGWIGCILPAKCMGGGASGLSLLIYYLAGGHITVGFMVLIINSILLVIAGCIVGWRFGIKTIFCVLVLSLSMSVFQTIFTLPDGTLLDIFKLDNRFLSCILGGIFSGIGVAMCFHQGGSTGGTDIVAMVINKYKTVSYGKIVRLSDAVIIGSALLLPEVGVDGVIYGLIMTVVFSYTVDAIMAGNQQSSQIFIISKDYRRMADAMNYEAHRGATVIDAVGWYSKGENKIIMVVCRKRDSHMVLKFAKAIDPEAFITVGSVMGVYGKGFDALNKV